MLISSVPGGDAECRTGNEIMGRTGCTGQCTSFGFFFHFLCDILHSPPGIVAPSMFPHLPHQWPQEEPLKEGLHVIVEAHEAAPEQQAHVSADVREEAVGVVDDVLEAIV